MAVSRRQRRRPGRWILAAIVVTFVVLIGNAALRSRASSAENLLAYLDQVRPDIQRSADEGTSLADVRTNAVTLGRDGITRRMDRLVTDAKATLAAVEGLTPPTSLRVAHAYLLTAISVRAKAAVDAQTALTAALAEGPPDPAVQGLVSVGQDIELSDRAYGLFSSSLTVPPAVPLPAAAWVSDPTGWAEPQLAVFVATLRSSTSLTPVHDLAVVTFTTEPPPVGLDNADEVIPPTKGLQIPVVVADVGNLPERHVTVTATLYTNGANTTETVRDFVDLVPGQQIAVTMGSLHPVSGTTGTLTVSVLPVPGETNLANNSQQWAVELR